MTWPTLGGNDAVVTGDTFTGDGDIEGSIDVLRTAGVLSSVPAEMLGELVRMDRDRVVVALRTLATFVEKDMLPTDGSADPDGHADHDSFKMYVCSENDNVLCEYRGGDRDTVLRT